VRWHVEGDVGENHYTAILTALPRYRMEGRTGCRTSPSDHLRLDRLR